MIKRVGRDLPFSLSIKLPVILAPSNRAYSKLHRGSGGTHRATGILHGDAIPAGTGATGGGGTGFAAVGLGDQWLRLGNQCGAGDAAGRGDRFQRGSDIGGGTVCAGGIGGTAADSAGGRVGAVPTAPVGRLPESCLL